MKLCKLTKTDKIFIEAYISNKILKKIRLKVDPLNKNLKDFAHLNGYEGYILSENILEQTIDVILLGDLDEPIIKNIPYDCIDKNNIVPAIEKFKIAVKLYLEYKLNVDKKNSIYKIIDNYTNRKKIEKKLEHFGLSKQEIFEIYKLYVLTNETI